MACVTPAEVKKIMTSCTLEDEQIDPFIVSARAFVTSVLSTDTTLSTSIREEIEKWFTAHLIASTTNRMTSREKIGSAEVEYASKYGEGLNSTPYGQMVLLLDKTGLLANSGKKAASIYAVKQFNELDE